MLFLVWEQLFLQFWNQDEILYLFYFLKILIRAKMTFADFFSHTWFGGFSNKYQNYEYLGNVITQNSFEKVYLDKRWTTLVELCIRRKYLVSNHKIVCKLTANRIDTHTLSMYHWPSVLSAMRYWSPLACVTQCV